MNALIETPAQPALASTPEAAITCGAAREHFARASMAELITLGRMFWAAINSRPGSDEAHDEATRDKRDDEMGVLADFDDELSVRIIERAPKDPAERALKASYLIARIRSENMSQAAEDMAQQWVEDAAMGLV